MLQEYYTFAWWQMGLFKMALIALGIIIGSSWPVIFKKPTAWLVLWLVLIILILYLTYIAFWGQAASL